MPNPKGKTVTRSEKERHGLEKLVKQHQTAQQIALRARIVLASAEGKTNTTIADQNEVSHNTVRLWRNRWVSLPAIPLEDLSVEARLHDGPRPGAPSQITADQRCQIEALACEPPEESGRPITHWSAREIADEIIARKIVEQISPRHAARLLKIRRSQTAFNPLSPEGGLTTEKDERFDEKVADLNALYQQAPELAKQGVRVESLDEMTGVQVGQSHLNFLRRAP